jgi:hypothetical protein
MRHYFFLKNNWYFLTYRTKHSFPVLGYVWAKELILDRIDAVYFKTNDYFSFSILDNHFHLLVFVEDAKVFSKKLQYIIGGSAFEINKKLGCRGSIWGRHFVLPVNGENNLFRVSSYVLGNPLRHGLVKDLNELYQYRFANFYQFYDRSGKAFAENLVLSGLKLKVSEEAEEKFWRDIIGNGRI